MRLFAVFAVYFLVLIGHAVNAGIYNIFLPDTRLSGFVMEKISPIGMEMCVKQCSRRVSCASLNFHRIRLECELSYSDGTTNPSNMTSDAEYIYAERSQIPQEYFDACSASCSARGSCIQASTGPKCFKSDCPEVHPDANTTSVKVTATQIGSVLTYTCNGDPSIVLTSTCKSDGTWSSNASSCISSECVNISESCWEQYKFDYDNSFDGCSWGTRYVRRTQYPSAPFVGVVLCSPTRYKIVLGENLTSQFLSIGDGAGSGEDHCELLGGTESNAVTANDYSNASSKTGYFRSNWGETFSIGPIGQGSFKHYNTWYECGVTIAPDPPQPACFNTTTSCWYEYNFVHDTAWNGCSGGKKYVKKTQFASAPLVGVVLCSPTRYKIFLGANLTDTFLNVGDGAGQGQDHCQLVGGLETNAVLSGDYSSAPSLTGYARSHVNKEFTIRAIAGGGGWYSNSWYECGVEIPPIEPG